MEDVTRNVRTYDHFCLTARALERVGDRWSLLVIRDLLTGAKRFTDLMDRLGGITPKTLSQRLRELEDAGIVASDREPGRREVWYRLTPAGADLRPVLDALEGARGQAEVVVGANVPCHILMILVDRYYLQTTIL